MCLGIVALVVFACNYVVKWDASSSIHDDVNDVQHETWGMLLGTAPQSRLTGKRNFFFKYRIDAALELYNAGKIDSLLISGDEHSLDGVNEPVAMRDTLVKHGMPASVIVLDGKGYRTQASLYNTCTVYGIKSFIVISQQFHNERAVFLAHYMSGLDVVQVQGYNAQAPTNGFSFVTYAREYFARFKLFIDLLT